MVAAAVEAEVVLAEGRAVVGCHDHREAFRVEVWRDLLAVLPFDQRVACPEHHDHRSAVLRHLIDRVLELHVPTLERESEDDRQYSRELEPTLMPDGVWPAADASVPGHQRLRQPARDPESQRESESEQGSPIVRAPRYRGLEVASQDRVFPIRGPDFRNEWPIVRKRWKTAEAV